MKPYDRPYRAMPKAEYSQNRAHFYLLSGAFTFLVSFGMELGTAHSFAELITPAFVGRALVQLGSVGVALFGALKVKP